MPKEITLSRMPDGSFRLYGLSKAPSTANKAEMRPWSLEEDEGTGEHWYSTQDIEVARRYGSRHAIYIQEPT